jgi:aspartate carbamoyltransferase catalytic subunit
METITTLSKNTIQSILKKASIYKQNDTRNTLFQNKIFGLLFFEPSTRTSLSFESAIHRFGGKIIRYNSQISSEKKGEDLEDTIKTLDAYVDILIIRHPNKNIISTIKQYTHKPIINAGNGDGEHPTQALLDLFTIMESFPNFPTKIAFTGDIKYSRTIHSLLQLLTLWKPSMFYYFICDPQLEPPDFILNQLQPNSYSISNTLHNDSIKTIDVLYVTRLQKERFINENVSNIIITKDLLKNSKQNLIIMHPLPRNDEIPKEFDTDPRSKYFEQVKNGVYVRMAILYHILQKN